jgi:hypothetical protein
MLTTTIAARYRRLATIVTAAIALGLTGVLGLAASPTPARADGHAWDYLLPAPGACGPAESDANASAIDQRNAGMCLANAARQRYSRTRLGPEPSGVGSLVVAAYFKARDVSFCPNDYVHNACGQPRDYWIQRYHYTRACTSGAYAENIYTGWGYGANTAREAVRWWLNSDAGHRDALLDPQWTLQGMNVYRVPGTYKGNPDTQIWVHYLCR